MTEQRPLTSGASFQRIAQDRQHRDLFRVETGDALTELRLGLRLDLRSEIAIEIAIDDVGMDVAFAADRRRVAKTRGDALDRLAQIAPGLRGAVKALELVQGHGRKHGACPGPEILRRDVEARDLAEIEVDVARGDVLGLALVVQILD